MRRGTRGARGAAGIERAAAAAAALSGVWRVGAPPQVGNKASESVYPGNHAEATFYLASSGSRSTEAGCDSCRRVTRCKGGSVNSKATQTGVLSLDLAVRVTEAGEFGAAAAKALNLEPLAGRSTEAGCDSCGHVTIEAKEAA